MTANRYNNQDLRASEAAVEPDPLTPYADELVNYTYNNVNALTRINDPGDKPLSYDASGNLTQGYTPAGYPFTAAYDSTNRLTTFTYTDGGGVVNLTEFFYMDYKLMKKKTYQNGVLSQERRYVYDGALLMQERTGADMWGRDTVVNEYTYGLGLPGGIGGLLNLNQGGANYSYLYDGKGNVTALLDGTGNVAASYQYDPFGVPRGPANTLSQPMQFSTKPWDDKTGLSYYGYRFYASGIGRWLTRDPLGEAGGINLYGFAGNNAVNRIDPMGLEYAELYTGYGIMIGSSIGAGLSALATGATAGANIILTPAQIAAGGAIGGMIGNAIGNLLDQNFLAKGERGWEKGRGDDELWEKTPEELKEIEKKDSDPGRRCRARKIRKMKEKKRGTPTN